MFSFTSPRNQWRALLFAGLFCALSLPVLAQQALLTSDVSVDVTATDAQVAREKAMAKAEREGFGMLLDRLAPDKKDEIMKTTDDATLKRYVKGTEVLQERVLGNRYRATLRISYDIVELGQSLDKSGEIVVPKSGAVLILPLLVEGDHYYLWEKSNDWKGAWGRAMLERPGGGIVVAYGDAQDQKVTDASTVQGADFKVLEPFFQRYGASEVAIALAKISFEDEVDVVVRYIRPPSTLGGGVETFVFNFTPDPTEDRTALLQRAARDLAAHVNRRYEDMRRQFTATVAADAIEQVILVPYRALGEWTKARTALLKIKSVKSLRLLAMSGSQVDARIQYIGTTDALQRDIEAAGLRLQVEKDYWVISSE